MKAYLPSKQKRSLYRMTSLWLLTFWIAAQLALGATTKKVFVKALRGEKVPLTFYLPAKIVPSAAYPLLIAELPGVMAAYIANANIPVIEVHPVIQRLRALYSPDKEVRFFYKQILDLAQQEFRLDKKRIGVMGGSGGGIFSYRLCGLEKIKVAVPIAAPYDVQQLLYPHHTVMLAKGIGLIGIIKMVSLTGQPVYIRKWAKKSTDDIGQILIEGKLNGVKPNLLRVVSPRYYLKHNRCASLINNSWHDFFMGFGSAWKNYQAIHQQKMFMMSEGAHGSEIRPEEIAFQFSQAFMWLEHFLKGKENGITQKPPLLFSLPKSQHPFHAREMEHYYFDRFPPKGLKQKIYNLSPEGRLAFQVSPKQESLHLENGIDKVFPADPADFLIDMMFTLLPKELTKTLPSREKIKSIPIFRSVVRMFSKFVLPLQEKLKIIYRKESSIRYAFLSEPLKKDTLLLGSPVLKITLSHDTPPFQLHARLLEIKKNNQESLITQGSITALKREQRVVLELEPMFYRLSKGSRLKLLIATVDYPTALPLFTPFTLDLEIGKKQSTLLLPLLEEKAIPPPPLHVRWLKSKDKLTIVWQKPKKNIRGFFVYKKVDQRSFSSKPKKKEQANTDKGMKEVLKAVGKGKLIFANGFQQIGFVPASQKKFLAAEQGVYAVSTLSDNGRESDYVVVK